MKCPRTAAHPSTNDHWAFHVTIKNQPLHGRGELKNEHMKRQMLLFWLIGTAIWPLFLTAQNRVKQGWHLLDKATDGYYGISLEKAYNFLKDKKANTVIVAVIDGGSDTTHEDLKDVLYRKTSEMPSNGKDDDKNGYVDDVSGWNFLGNRNGENVRKENLEATRLYHQMKEEYENKPYEYASLNNSEKARFDLWQKVNKKLSLSDEEKFNYRVIKTTSEALAKQDSILKKALGKSTYTIEELEKANFEEESYRRVRFAFLRTAQMLQFEPDKTNTDLFEDFEGYLSHQEELIKAKTVPLRNYRAIVGDNPDDLNDRNYGNADIMGPDCKHGTHVAGIIAASRNNGKGMDGVANNVRILTLRAVPDGDEYDKDVALAIRYAADNGAKVVNMSFGKDFSPGKPWVDEAIKYAASKDVLLVHAAGNDAKNIDLEDNYPSAVLNDNTIAANMLTVGASGDSSIKSGIVAPFTNYGKATVDVLAPGIKIYSTVPGGNKYSFQEGTSMAAPVVSGIAALIRGYFPELSAPEVKQIIIQSVDSSLNNQIFPKPGSEEETITMSELCVSGGIVNAYNALVLAERKATAKRKSKF